MKQPGLSWWGIVRLGLVQTALGAVVVLTTSTINRVMIVELALPAMLPGILVAWHYALQVLRPRWGHGSDLGGLRAKWIISGMAVLGAGGICAAASVQIMTGSVIAGIVLATVAFTLIGIGVGAAGTSLLVLLAKSVAEKRRAAAATIVWIMMIAGFVVTAAAAGHFLDPFSPPRLLAIASVICGLAFLLTLIAVWGVEASVSETFSSPPARTRTSFRVAVTEAWSEPLARRFAIFIFVSMLAYSAQDLILEPFAGIVFGYSPGQSTSLSSIQNASVLIGMILVGVAGTVRNRNRALVLRTWTIAGCFASALALVGLVAAALVGPGWPLKTTVFALGFANGIFAVAAIGSMFSLASHGGAPREGVRMGIFGAAQAIAFGLGGFCGTVMFDAIRFLVGMPTVAYAAVFALEACMFVLAASLALRIGKTEPASQGNPLILAARYNVATRGH